MDIKAHIEKVKNLVPGKMSAQEQAFVLSLLELVLQELEEALLHESHVEFG